MAGEDGSLPNSSIQNHGDGDVEVAESFGHFLTENDILKILEDVQESPTVVYDESLNLDSDKSCLLETHLIMD